MPLSGTWRVIGCTILRAVSGILRTQRGRSGSGPRRHPANSPRPRGLSLRPCGSTSCHLLSPLWLSSPPLWLNSLSSGRRRQSATSHGPWEVCLGRPLPRQIKPGPSVAAAALGAQREAGLGWQGLRVATGAPCTLSHLAGVGSQPRVYVFIGVWDKVFFNTVSISTFFLCSY